MKKTIKIIAFTLLSSYALSNTASADIILPDPDCGIDAGSNCLVFDDFTVYSMSFLQYNLDGSLKPVSGDTYYIESSPGQIADDIVIATSPAAAKTNTDVATNVDNAYDTPNQTGSELFAMTGTDPAADGWTGDNIQQSNSLLPNISNLDIDGDGTGDGDLSGDLSLWDIQVSELTTFLDGDDLLFFFNLNEKNKEDTLDAGQDMLAFATVTLTSSADGSSIEFIFSGNNITDPFLESIQSQDQTAGVDNILPTAEDDWGYVHGQICVDSTNGAVLFLGSCTKANSLGIDTTNGVTVDQNLGANSAAFALWNEDLNDALYSGLYDVLTVDLRMSHIDNGYDQLFIRAGQVEREVPEPASILLLIAGLAGLGVWHRRKVC